MGTLWVAFRPYAVGAALGGIIAVIAVLLFNRPAPVAPVASASALAKIEGEVAAIVKADNLRAAATATSVSHAADPGAEVLSRVTGLPVGQSAAILSASRAPTRTVATVTAKLSVAPTSPPPTPMEWTDSQVATLVAADQYAVRSVLNDPATKIPVAVALTQEEVPVSRCGSSFSASGSGLACAFLRRNRYEATFGLVQRANHLSPSLSAGFLIPHTSLSGGPQIVYDRGFHVGLTLHAYF